MATGRIFRYEIRSIRNCFRRPDNHSLRQHRHQSDSITTQVQCRTFISPKIGDSSRSFIHGFSSSPYQLRFASKLLIRRCSNTISKSSKPTLTLYTKEDCSLCDEAMNILAPHMDKVNLEVVDITLPENQKWFKKYRYDIPVFHLNGEFLMKHRAELPRFLQAISELQIKSDISV